MPTTRPRYQVTETDAVGKALDGAARLWPGESRARLLVRVIEAGAVSVAQKEVTMSDARRTAFRALSSSFDGMYPTGYLADLREDWPL